VAFSAKIKILMLLISLSIVKDENIYIFLRPEKTIREFEIQYKSCQQQDPKVFDLASTGVTI